MCYNFASNVVINVSVPPLNSLLVQLDTFSYIKDKYCDSSFIAKYVKFVITMCKRYFKVSRFYFASL